MEGWILMGKGKQGLCSKYSLSKLIILLLLVPKFCWATNLFSYSNDELITHTTPATSNSSVQSKSIIRKQKNSFEPFNLDHQNIFLLRSTLNSLKVQSRVFLPMPSGKKIPLSVANINTNSINSRSIIANAEYEGVSYSLILTYAQEKFYGTLHIDDNYYRITGDGNLGKIYSSNWQEISLANDFIVSEKTEYQRSFLQDYEPNNKQNYINSMTYDEPSIESTSRILLVVERRVVDFYNDEYLTRMEHLVKVANTAFQKSNVLIKLEIVGHIVVDYPKQTTFINALYDITFVNDPVFADIEQVRYEIGADMVALMLKPDDTTINGFAWINGKDGRMNSYASSMYSVINPDAEDYILAHELGHNFGLNHSRLENPGGGAAFSYGVGYGVLQEFSTIMAYKRSFQTLRKVYQFSDPDNFCDSHTCGVNEIDSINGSNARKALNLVSAQVSSMYEDDSRMQFVSSFLDENIDKGLNNCLLSDDNKALTYIGMYRRFNCKNEELSSIVHISDFYNLYQLNLSDNSISDISPLSSLTKLSSLTLDNNNIKDLSPIFHHPISFEYLSVIGNSIYCWQLQHFKSNGAAIRFNVPTDCDSSEDLLDYDGDGLSNEQELINGSDPTLNAASNGYLAFSQDEYLINRNQSTHELDINRHNGNIGSLDYTATITRLNNKLKSDVHFIEPILKIKHGQLKASVQLVIDEENVNANDEFLVTLSSERANSTAKITVIDNERKANASANVRSGGGSLQPLCLFLLLFLIYLKKI